MAVGCDRFSALPPRVSETVSAPKVAVTSLAISSPPDHCSAPLAPKESCRRAVSTVVWPPGTGSTTLRCPRVDGGVELEPLQEAVRRRLGGRRDRQGGTVQVKPVEPEAAAHP